METIALNEKACLTYRDTPWDAAIFGFKTSEILSITYDTESSAHALLDAYEGRCKKRGVRFTCTRISAQDLLLKKLLLQNGFYFAETSLRIFSNIPATADFGNILKSDLAIEHANQSDYKHIKDIARSNFHHGRFIEDSCLPREVARERFSAWIDDLIRHEADFLVFRKGGIVRTFMAYKREGRNAELILGGSESNLGYLTPLFWSSVFTHLQKTGIRQLETTISAANIVIFNIYILFGFKVRSTLFGFHKFYADQT